MPLIASNVLRGLAFAGTNSAARGHALILIALHFSSGLSWTSFTGTSTDCFTVFPLVYDYEDGLFSPEICNIKRKRFSSVELKRSEDIHVDVKANAIGITTG